MFFTYFSRRILRSFLKDDTYNGNDDLEEVNVM